MKNTINLKGWTITILGILIIALGLTGLAGWLFNNHMLKNVFSVNASMKWNTALLIVSLGILLLLLEIGNHKTVAILTALLMVAVILIIAEHIFSIDPGIDQWAVKDIDTHIAGEHPGRTSALTAGTILLMLTSVVAILQGWIRTSQIICGLAFFVLYAVLMGHLFSEEEFYIAGRFSGMAFHTGVALILFDTGLLLLHARRGFMQVFMVSVKGRTGLLYLGFYIVTFLPMTVGASRWLLQHHIFSATAAVLIVTLLSTIISIPVIYFILKRISLFQNDLSRAQQRLEIAMDAAGLGSYDLDLQTRKLTCNAQCKANFGFSSDELFSYLDLMDVIHPDFVNSVHLFLQGASSLIEPRQHEEFKIVLPDGSHRWISIYAVTQYNAEKVAINILGITADITSPKEAEYNKDAFIGIASHELKTPLTTVKGYVQLLEKEFQAEHNSFPRNALKKIDVQLDKMSSMINNFLHVSRSGADILQIEKQSFSMNALINEIIEEYNLKPINHQLQHDKFPEIKVIADKEKIGQVLNNLINNAIKYSKPNGIIEIILIKEKNQLVAGVKDEGTGIAARDLSRLFERFYRVDNKENKLISGFGLGLYLSAEIIELHGGKIWAESKKNQGTIFYFTLPVA